MKFSQQDKIDYIEFLSQQNETLEYLSDVYDNLANINNLGKTIKWKYQEK